MEIGKSIKKNREFQGLSRKELADILNINVSTLGRYETGKRKPDLNTLKEIANALCIDLDILLSWTDILNSHPNVFEFLEKVFYGFNYLEKLALLLGTNPHDKTFSNFFNCDFSDKALYVKISDILELTDMQLYNWILLLRIKHDYYKNKAFYVRDYMPTEDCDRIDYMISSNKANLKIQPFDDLFYNGINNENKLKIKTYLEMIHSSNRKSLSLSTSEDEFNCLALKTEEDEFSIKTPGGFASKPEIVNIDLAYNSLVNLIFYIGKEDALSLLDDKLYRKLLTKTCDLLEFELFKIEKENTEDKDK